jgi:tetratricopeptide (TPR) repeat protein
MLRRSLHIALMVLGSITGVFAQADALKQQADQAYLDGNYGEATELYEQVLAQNYVSAELHYNLGNAYYKQNRTASAILNYERALKLAPKDEDIQFNLKLANLSVKDEIQHMPKLFFVNWFEQILKVFSTDGWAWSAVISFVLVLVGAVIFRMSEEEGLRRLSFYTAVVLLLWFGFSVYAARNQYDDAVNDNRAVVFATTLTAKSAPDRKGKELFVIHEGLVVSVSDELNGWVRVKLSDGNVGWVEKSELVMI